MKIYSTPCGVGPSATAFADRTIRRLHAASEQPLHQMVSDPDAADFILISNLPLEVDQRALRNHPLLPRYVHKSYALWDSWNTPRLLPGVYVNATRGSLFGRFRTGSYALLHPDFKNPFVEAFDVPPSSRPEPDLLFSFLGRYCHPCRAAIFGANYLRKDILIEDTSAYNAFSHVQEGKEADQRRYLELCLRSKFMLCPRGAGASSIRLFEALRLGIAPIILSDAWLPCVGPDWKRAAIFVKENDVHRLEEIVAQHEPRWREMGVAAREIHDRFFSEKTYFNFLIANVSAIARQRVIPERPIYSSWTMQVSIYQARARWAAALARRIPQPLQRFTRASALQSTIAPRPNVRAITRIAGERSPAIRRPSSNGLE